jgi:hypothetical protein
VFGLLAYFFMAWLSPGRVQLDYRAASLGKPNGDGLLR